MKEIRLLAIITIMICLTGTLFSWFLLRKSHVTPYNKVVRAVYKSLRTNDYQSAQRHLGVLLDSLRDGRDEVKVNFAHAGYRLRKSSLLPDSLLAFPRDTMLAIYGQLTEAKNVVIRSESNNQLGNAGLKFQPAAEPDAIDQRLREARDYYAAGLRADPGNDSIRYNYELLSRVLVYPDVILQRVESLIAQRQYGQAYELFQEAKKRDARLQRYQDMEQRIFAIYQINRQ